MPSTRNMLLARAHHKNDVAVHPMPPPRCPTTMPGLLNGGNDNRPNNTEVHCQAQSTCSCTQPVPEDRSHTTPGAARWNGNRNAASRSRVMNGCKHDAPRSRVASHKSQAQVTVTVTRARVCKNRLLTLPSSYGQQTTSPQYTLGAPPRPGVWGISGTAEHTFFSGCGRATDHLPPNIP